MTTTPKQLKVRFAYQFSGEHLGRTFYRGRFPTFVKLCEDVDAVLRQERPGFNWLQIKEKWGAAHFYWEMRGSSTMRLDVRSAGRLTSIQTLEDEAGTAKPSLPQRVTELVRQAERDTATQCIVCGRSATISAEEAWILALCEEHARLRRTVTNWSAWMQEHALFGPEEQ